MSDPCKLFELRASSSHRWMECPGSAFFAKALPPSPSSVYAARGTLAADILSKAILHGFNPQAALGKTYLVYDIPEGGSNIDLIDDSHPVDESKGGHKIAVEQEDIDAIKVAVNEVSWMREIDGLKVESEQEVNNEIANGATITGHFDIRAYNNEHLEVIDYKHGVGVAVSAIKNYQLLCYLAGTIAEIGPRAEYTLSIIQPRSRAGAKHSSWKLTHEEFVAEWSVVVVRVMAIRKAASSFMTHGRFLNIERFKKGDHCRWCPGMSACPLHALNAASMLVAANRPINPAAAINGFVPYADSIREFLKSIEGDALARMNAGEKFEGLKLVRTSGRSSWKKRLDEGKLAELIELKLVKPVQSHKFKPVGDGRKALGDRAGEFIDQGKGSVKVVRTDQPGEPVEAIVNAFSIEESKESNAEN